MRKPGKLVYIHFAYKIILNKIRSDPTPELNELIQSKWTPTTSSKMEYYFLHEPHKSEMREGLYLERVKFLKGLPLDSRLTEIVKDEL